MDLYDRKLLAALALSSLIVIIWPGSAISTKKLSQNAICHSERSEESLISASQTLRGVYPRAQRRAQGDSFEIVSKEQQRFHPPSR